MLFAATGCSFTWGQGLAYHRWLEQTKTEEKSWQDFIINYQWGDVMHKLTNQDYIFQNSLRCAGLLAKTLKCEYLIQDENGGSNKRSFERIKVWTENHKNNPNRKLDFIILQLTELYRDHPYTEEGSYPICDDDCKSSEHIFCKRSPPWSRIVLDSGLSHEKFMDKFYSKDMFLKLDERCRSKGIDLLIWSWPGELARLLKDEDFFIKLKYGGREYISFKDIEGELPVSLHQDPSLPGVTDEHPNKFFNQLLHDSIIEKLKDRNII